MPTLGELQGLGTPPKVRTIEDLGALQVAPSLPNTPRPHGPLTPQTPTATTRTRGSLTLQSKPPTLTELAKRADVSTAGAPTSARLLMNLGETFLGTGEAEIRQVKSSLEKVLEKSVEVRRGSITDALEFRPEGEDQFILVNPPGFDLSDIAAATPEIVQIAGEIAAVFGGTVAALPAVPAVGPGAVVVGGAIAEGIGSFTLSVLRLKAAQDLGVDITDEEVWDSATKRAGLSMLGALAFPTMAIIFRKIMNKVPRKVERALLDSPRARQDIAALEQAIIRTEEISAAVKAETGEAFPLTVSQATRQIDIDPVQRIGPAEPALIAAEEAAESDIRRGGGPLSAVIAQQRRATLALQDKALGTKPTVGGATIPTAVALQREARRAPTAEMIRVRAETEAGRAAAVTQAGEATTTPLTAGRAGVSLRSALDAQKKTTFAPIKNEFDEIDQLVDLPDISAAAIRQEGRALSRELEGTIFRSLAKEDKPLIEEATMAGLKFSPEGEVIGDIPLKFSDVAKDLSNLKRELRRIDKGFSDKEKRIVTRLVGALTEARTAALKAADDPDLFARVLGAEAAFAKASEDFNRGVVREILAESERGVFRIKSVDLIPNLLNDPDDAARLAGILGSTSTIDSVSATSLIRAGMRAVIKQNAVDPVTGILDDVAYKTFFNDTRKASLRQFFSEAEMRQFSSAATASRTLKALEKREAFVTAKLEDSFGMQLGKVEPNVLLDQLFKPERLSDFKHARRLLKQSPRRLAEFDEALKQKVRDIVAPFDTAQNRRVVTLETLQVFKESGLFPHVKDAFGEEYFKNFDLLIDALAVANRTPIKNVADLSSAFRTNAGLQGLGRFLRVPFPPLTVRGRALTASVNQMGDVAMREMAEALADPKRLVRLMRLRHASLTSRRAETIFGGTFTVGASFIKDKQKRQGPR